MHWGHKEIWDVPSQKWLKPQLGILSCHCLHKSPSIKELEDLGQWALHPTVIRWTSIFSWVIPRLRRSFSRFITNTWDIKTFNQSWDLKIAVLIVHDFQVAFCFHFLVGSFSSLNYILFIVFSLERLRIDLFLTEDLL